MATRPGHPEEPAARASVRALVPLVSLGVAAALLVLRGADDNRLTSWDWVFAAEHPLTLYARLAAALGVASLAARLGRPRRPAAVLFAAACAAGACTWGAPEPVVDAARYFAEAKHLELYGMRHFLAEWGRSIPAWTDLPLVPLLDGVVLRVAGESRVALQVLGTLLFAGAVASTQRLGAALWDDEVGFLAGGLLLAMPYLLAQVPLVLVDVPSMLFVTLALVAVVGAVKRGGPLRTAGAALAVVLALLTKWSSALLLTAVPVVAAAVPGPGGRRSPRVVAAVGLAALAVAGAALLVRGDVLRAQLALLRDYQAPGLGRWGEGHASTFLFQIHPFVTVAALGSVVVAFRRRDPRWLVAAWPVLLLFALGVHRSRYWIPALPLLALLAARGLSAVRAREERALVAGCAVATSLVVALHGFVPFLERTSAANLAAAGAYLDGLDEARVEVLTAPAPDAEVNPEVSVALLDLFTAKALVVREPAPRRPTAAAIETSALRFTWEWARPRWYAADADGPAAAVALVADDLDAPLPDPVRARLSGMRLDRVFALDDGVFRHRTLVAVYREDDQVGYMPRLTSPSPSSSRSCFASSTARYERK